MILGVRACLSLSGITSRTRQTHRTTEPCINESVQTRAAYELYLAPLTTFLSSVGASQVIPPSTHVASPAVFVFLRQEMERRSGNLSLLHAVVDSLILWALEGTDPDKGIFKDREVIRKDIDATIPAARQFLPGVLDERLEQLASKKYPVGRQIRWHQKEDLFCLPYETRRTIASENTEDEALRIKVLDGFVSRSGRQLPVDIVGDYASRAADLALSTVQRSFERQGLEFSYFLSTTTDGEGQRTIADSLASIMDEASVKEPDRNLLGDVVLETLRQAFYSSTVEERLYFGKLARTYALLFTLQAEPRIVQYFEEMTADFYLYVGSDILIRALSERYLDPADQMTRNTLAMASQAGATLVLAEPVLEEVVAHIRASDTEFRNFVAPVEAEINLDMARQSPRILIRSYFYARFNPELDSPPANWPAYIQQFCDFGSLHKKPALAEIKAYLEAQFHLRFEHRDDLMALVDKDQVEELAKELEPEKRDRRLASNDALMASAVYGRRRRLGETSAVTEFGYRTWWLTGEAAILRHTQSLVSEHHGDRYMMRPEFLLNFIGLSPTTVEVRDSFHNIFPTMLGVRLARRMDEGVFRKLMDDVREAGSLEEGRKKAKIARLADKLKGDFRRQYAVELRAKDAL